MVMIAMHLGNTRRDFKGNIWGIMSSNFLWDNRTLNHLNKQIGAGGRDPDWRQRFGD